MRVNKSNSATWRVETPEGIAYITIVEESKGKIAFIQVSIGKAGTSLASIVYALAASVSANLQVLSVREVQSMLSGIASDRPKRTLARNSTRSIPEAIVWTLEQYLGELYPVVEDNARRLKR